MTENLLQKLEDKVVTLLSDMELLRNELKQAKHENSMLKAEKFNSTQKLQSMVTLLDSLNIEKEPVVNQSVNVNMQTREEYVVV